VGQLALALGICQALLAVARCLCALLVVGLGHQTLAMQQLLVGMGDMEAVAAVVELLGTMDLAEMEEALMVALTQPLDLEAVAAVVVAAILFLIHQTSAMKVGPVLAVVEALEF